MGSLQTCTRTPSKALALPIRKGGEEVLERERSPQVRRPIERGRKSDLMALKRVP